jgi:hypothetical protein
MKPAACLSTALVGLLALAADPVAAKDRAHSKQPLTCSALAGVVMKEAGRSLNKDPIAPSGFTISSATPVTATVVPASGSHLPYCQVVFQLDTAITIQVGLPLNTLDGGQGGGCSVSTVPNNSCAEGNWNGRIEAIGNGGYAGSVVGVTARPMSALSVREQTMATAATGATRSIRRPDNPTLSPIAASPAAASSSRRRMSCCPTSSPISSTRARLTRRSGPNG